MELKLIYDLEKSLITLYLNEYIEQRIYKTSSLYYQGDIPDSFVLDAQSVKFLQISGFVNPTNSLLMNVTNHHMKISLYNNFVVPYILCSHLSILSIIDMHIPELYIVPAIPTLEKLFLENNQLSIVKLSGIYPLLKYIEIKKNNLSNIDLTKTRYLYVLNLSYNVFVNFSSLSKINLSRLEVLILSHNLLNDCSQLFYYETPRLVTINLSHNNLSEFNVFIDTFPSLENLEISHNNMKRFISKNIKLNALCFLDLSHNQMDRIGVDILVLDNLITLDLRHNFFSETCSDKLIALNLKNLNLSYNQFKIIDRNLFIQMCIFSPPEVVWYLHPRTIDLSNNYLESFPSMSIDPIYSGKIHLNIINNNIPYIPHRVMLYPNITYSHNTQTSAFLSNFIFFSSGMTIITDDMWSYTCDLADKYIYQEKNSLDFKSSSFISECSKYLLKHILTLIDFSYVHIENMHFEERLKTAIFYDSSTKVKMNSAPFYIINSFTEIISYFTQKKILLEIKKSNIKDLHLLKKLKKTGLF